MDKNPAGTALALILACERLIAAHGSQIVSLRQITEAAGASNSSAVNYHFGSREGLMLAVFQYRTSRINQRRQDYIDQLAAQGRLLDQRSLVGAMVHPLSEQLAPRPEGNHYVRFVERISREGANPDLPPQEPLMTSWRELERMLKRTMAWLPDVVVGFRVQMMREHAVSGLAWIEGMLEQGAFARSGLALQIEMLIDGIAAMLAGPLSPVMLGKLLGEASAGESAIEK